MDKVPIHSLIGETKYIPIYFLFKFMELSSNSLIKTSTHNHGETICIPTYHVSKYKD